MSARHKYTKRPRYEAQTDSSSDNSSHNSCLISWKSFEESFESLINPILFDAIEPERDTIYGNSVVEGLLGYSAIEYCILLIEDLFLWLKKFNERCDCSVSPRVHKYTLSPALLEFQQQEGKKNSLSQLANGILKNAAKPGLLRTEAIQGAPPGLDAKEHDANLVHSALVPKLSSLLLQLQAKWEEIDKQMQPIDPIEERNSLLHDIQLDLEDIESWLYMLQANLPSTSVWMSTLNKLTEVQRRSASNYYQTKLKQIEQHSRTFTVMNQLLERVQNTDSVSPADQDKIFHLVQTVSGLENTCHVHWLRLLELTLCIDEKFLQNLNLTTQIPYMSSQNKHRYFITEDLSEETSPALPRSTKPGKSHFPCNLVMNPLERHDSIMDLMANDESPSRLQKYNFLSPNFKEKHRTESGFESELSPQSNLTGSSQRRLRGCRDGHQHLNRRSVCLGKQSSLLAANRSTPCLALYSDSTGDKFTYSMEGYVPAQKIESGFKPCNSDIKNKSSSSKIFAQDDTAFNGNDYEVPFRGVLETNGKQNPLQVSEKQPIINGSKQNGVNTANDRNVKRRRRIKRKQDLVGDKQRIHSKHIRDTNLPNCATSVEGPLLANADSAGMISESTSSDSILSTDGFPSSNLLTVIHRRPSDLAMCSDTLDTWEICELPTSSVDETRSAIEYQRGTDSSSDYTTFQRGPKTTSREKSRRKNPRLRHSTPALSVDSRRHLTSTIRRRMIGYVEGNRQPPNEEVKIYMDRKVGRSSSSSLAGDASELEQRGWHKQIRSFLDAASRAEAMIRSQSGSDSLKQWLESLNSQFMRPEGHQEEEQSGASRQHIQSGTSTRSSRLSNDSTDPDLTNISPSKVIDTQEPLMNYWDNYQVPLYSSSSETEAREPPTTYAEEFPWDDVGNPLSDQSQDELMPDGPSVPENVPTSYIPFCSSIKSDTQETHSGTSVSNVGRQDTMDLSTSTSVLFNQKSSSMEASFEVCSPSIVTIDSQVNNDQTSPSSSPPLTPSPSLIYGLRTHPDGGSQQRIDREPASQTPVATGRSQTPVRFLSLEPEYPDDKVTRNYHTLPRVTSKARIRHSISGEQADRCNSVPVRCSSAFSLEELKDLRNKWLCSDILVWSKQQLVDIKCALRRILTVPIADSPNQRHDNAKATHGENQTWLQWQNDISEVIRSAEWNLQVLIDHTSFEYNNQESDNPSTTEFLFTKLVNPEANYLQMQWKEIIEDARYWLLHSCSSEAVRQQLRILHAKVMEVTNYVQNLSSGTPGQAEEPELSRTSEYTMNHGSIQRMLQRCLNELKRLSGRMQRLQRKFEGHFSKKQHMAVMEDALRAFASNNTEILQQLDRLNGQLLANQEKLSKSLDVKISIQSVDSSTSSSCPHDNANFSEVVPQNRLCTCYLDSVHTNTSVTSPAQTARYLNLHPKFGRRQYIIIFVAGSLMFLSCLCCYLVINHPPCIHSPESWKAVFIFLGEWFPFLFDAPPYPCPLKRERLSHILDYTYGSTPI